VCRLMGRDMKIIAEVEARNEWWQATPARSEVQQALLGALPARSWDEHSGTDDIARERSVREHDVRDDLALALDGSIEMETPAGFADVVTATEVIKVKAWRNWKHSLGQVLAYHAFMSDKSKRIHLFA
ncbi:FirrV-1-A34, partial [Tribonema minus]